MRHEKEFNYKNDSWLYLVVCMLILLRFLIMLVVRMLLRWRILSSSTFFSWSVSYSTSYLPSLADQQLVHVQHTITVTCWYYQRSRSTLDKNESAILLVTSAIKSCKQDNFLLTITGTSYTLLTRKIILNEEEEEEDSQEKLPSILLMVLLC